MRNTQRLTVIDADPTWKDAATWLGGLLVGGLQLVGLWQIKRIGALEETSVTHDQLDTMLKDMKTTRADMHSENTAWLRRIEDKIDANEERRSVTEHTIRDTVSAVNLKVEVLAAKKGMV